MSVTAQLKRSVVERAKAHEDLKALYDEAGDAELTAEQRSLEEQLHETIVRCQTSELELLDEIERSAALAERYEQLGIRALDGPKDDSGPKVERTMRDVLTDVWRTRDQQGVKVSMVPSMVPDIQRDDVALVTGTATDGAELISTDLSTTLIDFLQESIGAVRAGARVLTTSSGNPLTIPTVTSHSTPAIVTEGGTFSRSAPQFGSATLNSYKYGHLVQISSEMLEDTAVNLTSFVVEQATDEIGRLIGTHFVTGTGSGQPNGITNAATVTQTSAAVAAWTFDELMDVYHSIVSRHRNAATWIVNDSTVLDLRKIKDSTGNYIWQTSLVAGTPDTLLGRPVVTDDAMPELGTGNASVVFGDLARAYIVRLVGSLEVAMSTDFAFDTDLVTWRFRARADGEIVNANAVCVGSNA